MLKKLINFMSSVLVSVPLTLQRSEVQKKADEVLEFARDKLMYVIPAMDGAEAVQELPGRLL